MNDMKNTHRYPCLLWLILHQCFFPRTLDFHCASFLGSFLIESGHVGLTNPCSSHPGDLNMKCKLFNRRFKISAHSDTSQGMTTNSYKSESSSSSGHGSCLDLDSAGTTSFSTFFFFFLVVVLKFKMKIVQFDMQRNVKTKAIKFETFILAYVLIGNVSSSSVSSVYWLSFPFLTTFACLADFLVSSGVVSLSGLGEGAFLEIEISSLRFEV